MDSLRSRLKCAFLKTLLFLNTTWHKCLAVLPSYIQKDAKKDLLKELDFKFELG